ncbi:helix-turn-helix domain-containing protein [Aestuariivirga sp.]|uniref:helix-turn-helix domain-containing protein n=1 Tax=Aestuariivirga sp. TaxID=2650926 RepID=UPI0039E70BE3
MNTTANAKIFAGPRLRRLRMKLGLTQAAMAQTLGLSASYLNLMERDQRPLTAQVVLKLSGMEGVDVSELAAGETAHALLPPLREMLADPLLAGEVPPGGELSEAAQAAPNFAAAALKLYGAYREMQKRLAHAARGFPVASSEPGAADWFQSRNNDDLENLAEEIWSELSPKDDIFAGLKARLRSGFGIDVRILPREIMDHDRSRYDRHSQRLFLSEVLGFEDRIRETAHLLARLDGKPVIDAALAASSFANRPDVLRGARACLVDHLAHAILAPRGKFTAAADDSKLDINLLSSRFSLSAANIMLRIASLKDSTSAIAFYPTGAVAVRTGVLPFYLTNDDFPCGQLPVFDEGSGFHVAALKPSDGKSFAAIAFKTANASVCLFLPQGDFEATIYAQRLTPRPVGSGCRLCEVRHCARRTAPSATRPAGLNDYVRGVTDFEPV